jgi:hypothetical protein
MSQSAANECCAPFDPSRWDEKTHVWQEKLFITDNIATAFHIPLNIKRVILRLQGKMLAADAATPIEESLMLFYDPSPWHSEIYWAVSHEVPDAKNIKLSGKFISKVFEGPYRAAPKWLREMDAFLAAQGKKSIKYYIHYAYCPKCAKQYGKNYGVVFAQVENAR